MNDADKIERLRDALRRLLRHKNEMGGGGSVSDDIRIAERVMADTEPSPDRAEKTP